MAPLYVQRLLRLPRGIVADGGVEHFAGAHQILQRAHRLLGRGERIVLVQEQHFDAVGPQALEARFRGTNDVTARPAAGIDVAAHRVVALRRDDQLVALAADQLAEDLLGAALVVLIRGIEVVDPRFAARAKHLRRRRFVGIAAEGHRPEAKLGYLHAGAAEGPEFHVGTEINYPGRGVGAEEGTRTPTILRSLAPEASASTNSATSAKDANSSG